MRYVRLFVFAIVISLSLSLAGSTAEPAADLTFEDRVRAQAAIERIHHDHRIGGNASFEIAVPQEVLEAKVREFLRQSHALERHWKTSITAYMLDRELKRMLGDTRDPARLRELFDALDQDPVLIRECLARPLLVDRLVRNFYAFDRRIHEKSRLEAEQLLAALQAGDLLVNEVHARRSVREFSIRPETDGSSQPDREEDASTMVNAETFAEWRASMASFGEIGELEERAGSFLIRTVLEEKADWVRAAVYFVPKRDPRDWWNEFEAAEVRTVADHTPIPEARGVDAGLPDASGWQPTDYSPPPRTSHQAIWTGSEMIVWGGESGFHTYDNFGGRYDPATDTWKATSTTGAPMPRQWFTAVWTGTEMIVWGGGLSATGGRYDPSTDTWNSTTLFNAPEARSEHTAVWTGTEMIVWGGVLASGDDSGSGASYNPASGFWTPLTTVGAPTARSGHTAVWAGDEMIVWGGIWYDDGGRYDPVSNSWSPVSDIGAPLERREHTAVWTGETMIVWGGDGRSDSFRTFGNGGRYDPVSDGWTPTSTSGLWHEERAGLKGVWTGSEVIVWGGVVDFIEKCNTGLAYDPSTASIRRIGSGGLEPRSGHSVVWTGEKMIVWGGCCGVNLDTGYEWHFNSGGGYDPVSGQWSGITSTNAPDPRAGHTAIWTGEKMIVWGGSSREVLFDPWGYPDGYEYTYYASGGVYDPDWPVWIVTPYPGEWIVTPRHNHTAVWTGEEMIVWGGYDGAGSEGTGARYDPSTYQWSATQTAGAPTPRRRHTSVWTGEEMIVWGGWADDSHLTNTGGRYDPVEDSWSPTSTRNAPEERSSHSAVWMGVGMLVWGGVMNTGGPDYGAKYFPTSDSWTALSSNNAPCPRRNHIAVPANNDMTIWGGDEQCTPDPQPNHIQGAVYRLHDYDGDGVPLADDCDDLNPFCTSDCTDADQDGYCPTLDCDDVRSATYPGAVEVNDGADNQCPGDPGYGLVDEIEGQCGFNNVADRNEFSWREQIGATSYEVARSSGGEFAFDCLTFVTAETSWTDVDPVPAGTCYHYLVRALSPNTGSWGANSAGMERTSICP